MRQARSLPDVSGCILHSDRRVSISRSEGPAGAHASRRATRDDLRIAVITSIERTYHRRRRQAALDRMTPIEYETITTPAAKAA